MARKPLFIKHGDTELRGNTIREMRALAEIVKDKDIPRKHEVKLGNVSSSGYGDDGEKNAFKLVLGAGAVLGLVALGRRLYYKYIKKSNPLQALPAPADPVVDATHEDVPEDECGEGDNEQPEETAAPTRKEWSEWFLDEFGPMPELPPMLQFVVERSPAGYEVAMTVTLLCAFAALCFSKVRAKYLDGKVHAPNLQVLVEGNWGAGKEKFMTALNALLVG